MPFFLTSDSEIEFHTGTINVTQPNMNITTIYRDDYGIPHIKAEKLVIIKKDGEVITDEKEMSNLFNNYFVGQIENLQEKIDPTDHS